MSRGAPSAVTVGAELLLDGDGEGDGGPYSGEEGGDWITAAEWAEDPDVLARALLPFLRGDDGGAGGGRCGREGKLKR